MRISKTLHSVLRVVKANDGLTNKEISKILGLDTQCISQYTRKLYQQGLIEREEVIVRTLFDRVKAYSYK